MNAREGFPRSLRLCLVLGAAALAPAALAQELTRKVDSEIEKLGPSGKVSVLVKSITTGEVLYSRDADEARTPASTMKLATTAAAIELLGKDFEHETSVFAQGTVDAAGTLKGDLYVRGSGDPTISRRFQLDDTTPLLADWADELKGKVKAIEGDVVADDRAFERLGFHPDWNEKEAQDWYAAEVSALNLNDNCLDVSVVPGSGGVHASFKPETRSIVLDNKATLTPSRAAHAVSYVRDASGPTIHVSGKVWDRSPAYEAPVAVRSPALLFANVLLERLATAGVTVKGKARLVADQDPEPKGTPLLTRRSPIQRTLSVCNKKSQNLYAECLLKTLGARKGTAGSWAGGAKVVEKWVHDLGVPEGEVKVHDGSGLSREDRLSARALVAILEHTAKGLNAEAFRDTLSIAGEDGTLEKRLPGLPKGATFRGKTGTMHGVSALAGLLELERGAHGEREVIALAFVVNGTHGAALARHAQDEAVRSAIRDRASPPRTTASK